MPGRANYALFDTGLIQPSQAKIQESAVTLRKADSLLLVGQRLLTTGFALSLATVASAGQPTAQVRIPMDQVAWVSESDRFMCKLELNLGKHGELAFVHAAGAQRSFRYIAIQKNPDEVAVASITAPWLKQVQSEWVPLEDFGDGFRLDATQTRSLASAMKAGLWTVMKVDQSEIVVPTIRWGAAITVYRNCQETLSPMSVSQARENVLSYRRGQTALEKDQITLLEDLALYIQLDARVTRVLVDGHTDRQGERIANLQLSRERAVDVAAILTASGVERHMIEIRAHGDRYPVADNQTSQGRDENRRVTLRVIRE